MSGSSRSLAQRLRFLAAEFEQAADEEQWDEVTALDEHLQALINGEALQHATNDPRQREEVRTALDDLTQIHAEVFEQAQQHHQTLGHLLRRLHSDRDAADTYTQVRLLSIPEFNSPDDRH